MDGLEEERIICRSKQQFGPRNSVNFFNVYDAVGFYVAQEVMAHRLFLLILVY